jgi:hypothetical protein
MPPRLLMPIRTAAARDRDRFSFFKMDSRI